MIAGATGASLLLCIKNKIFADGGLARPHTAHTASRRQSFNHLCAKAAAAVFECN